MNEELGLGLQPFRADVRYTKATPEVGVDNMQVVWPELPPEKQRRSKKKKKPAKGK